MQETGAEPSAAGIVLTGAPARDRRLGLGGLADAGSFIEPR